MRHVTSLRVELCEQVTTPTILICNINTQRGQRRAQRARDREVDIERAKNWRLVHLRRPKGETRRAEPMLWLL